MCLITWPLENLRSEPEACLTHDGILIGSAFPAAKRLQRSGNVFRPAEK